METTKPKQKYFEVFGNTVNQLSFFKKLTLILVGLLILQVLIIRTALKKEPLVIRVNEIGTAEAVNPKFMSAVTGPEISNFTKTFLEHFLAWNYYTYDNDFKKAFSMMTGDAIPRMNDWLRTNNVMNNIKDNQLKTTLTISEIKVVKDVPEFIILKVKGSRIAKSYNNNKYRKETIFEDELTLKKVQRTEEYPWGLLVDSWVESVYKQ